jgi:hypothetical protein
MDFQKREITIFDKLKSIQTQLDRVYTITIIFMTYNIAKEFSNCGKHH